MNAMIFSLGLKILEWFLDRSAMKKQQKKALISWVRESQKTPVSSYRVKQILENAESDILAQEAAMKKGVR